MLSTLKILPKYRDLVFCFQCLWWCNTCFADLPSSMSNQPIDQLTILPSVFLSAYVSAPFVLALAPFLCLMSAWCQLDVLGIPPIRSHWGFPGASLRMRVGVRSCQACLTFTWRRWRIHKPQGFVSPFPFRKLPVAHSPDPNKFCMNVISDLFPFREYNCS